MRAKYVLGLIIPIIVLIVMAVIMSLNIGFSVIKEHPDYISSSDFTAKDEKILGPTVLKITASNSFIVERNMPLNFVLCTKENLDYYGSNSADFAVYVDDQVYDTNRLYIKPNEIKVIKIKPAINSYDYNEKTDYYNNVTELLIFEGYDKNDWNICSRLVNENYDSAIKIQIK